MSAFDPLRTLSLDAMPLRVKTETPQLDEFIAPLIGQPVWGARQGYGSFLSLHFGAPKLIVKEWQSPEQGLRRQAYVEGEWIVWIYCCEWRFLGHDAQIAHSEDGREDISRATGMMNGQKLVQVVVDQSNGRASFHFDLGGLLETWPVGDDPTEEQWFIYSPEKQAFGYRADGKFSSSALDTARSDERWRSFG